MNNIYLELTDELTGNLVALSKTASSHGLEAEASGILVDGLAATVPGRLSEQELRDALLTVKGTKFQIAPGCRTCNARCGNSDNLDMAKVYAENPEIRSLKFLALAAARDLASELQTIDPADRPKEVIDFLYQATAFLSFDLEADAFRKLIMKAADLHLLIAEKEGL